MIDPDRFIANKAIDKAAWLEARLHGVTATEVAKAATPAGFKEVQTNRANPTPVEDNVFMEFGRANEGWLSLWVKQEFGVMPNEWLIAADVPQYLATPDGLSLDHTTIAEIKTGGKEGPIPVAHKRQMQWQLRVTGADSCVYAFMLRTEVGGVMVPAWLEPRVTIVYRDDQMIAALERTADQLLIDFEGWTND